MNCELAHSEGRVAVSRAILICLECSDRWEILLCAAHGNIMNQLTARGDTLTCKCGATFPMLNNVTYGVV